MNDDLKDALLASGVRENVVQMLEEDELLTAEDVSTASDELLRSCGIPCGQILRIKSGIAQLLGNRKSTEERSPATLDSSMSSLTQEAETDLDSGPQMLTPIRAFSYCSPPKSLDKPCNNGSCWLKDFQLPSAFSPAVTQALASKKLTGVNQNEFTRDICSSTRIYTMYPTKTERQHVAFLGIKKYPFLEDSIGTGIGSWETAFKHRFKNIRKKGRKLTLPSLDVDPSMKDNIPHAKKRKIEECVEMPEGETEETCKEHIEALKKEMARKTNKNMALIKKLMELTFAHRRTTILKETVAVSELLKIYPALKLQSTVKEEFGRILGKPNPLKYMANTFKEVWVQKILKYGLMQTVGITVKASVDEALEDNPDRKNAIEEAAAVYLLPHFLKEKGGSAENSSNYARMMSLLTKLLKKQKPLE